MKLFKRYGLLIITNLLVVLTISISFTLITSFLGLTAYNSYLSYTLLLCAMMGFGGAFISLLISKWMAKRAYGVEIIDPNTIVDHQRKIVATVHRLSKAAGLEVMPEVGIFESPEINAFATGPSRKNSMVALSTGLLNAMTEDEVEGVIGHEVAHIANGDMVTLTLIQGVVNTFVMFLARIVANIVASNVEEKSRPMVHLLLVIVLDIVFSILGSIVVNYFSRAREFRADAGGARFAGRQKMIAGLRRLQSQFEMITPDNSGAATMKISNRSTGLASLFSTHPSLEERIARLENIRA
jgi:heat shock protein HtpX